MRRRRKERRKKDGIGEGGAARSSIRPHRATEILRLAL